MKGKNNFTESIVFKDLDMAETSQVIKSNIGRGVKLGQRTKITNSIIMSNVTIGNE